MTELSFGVGLPLSEPMSELRALGQEAEALGCRFVWANDDGLGRDCFATLAALACDTERVHLGPGVTNPYSRHPALLATALATLDELSGGRAVLGLGAGGTNHRALGVRREAPAVALRESIELLRGLWEGREVTLEGRVVQAREAHLDFVPRRADIPIYIGARGPRVLEMAGELGDGVIVGNLASVEAWRYVTDRVAVGAERAGRDPGELDLVAWLYTSIGDDADAARDAVRPMVATSLVTSRPILAELGVELPAAFVRVMEAENWSLARASVTRAGTEVPVELLDRFSLAGTAAECRDRLRVLLDAFPRISQVALVPFAPAEERKRDVLRRFMREVAPTLVSEAVTKTPDPFNGSTEEEG